VADVPPDRATTDGQPTGTGNPSEALSAALDAIMLTLRVKILDHRLPPGGSRYSSLRGQPESHLLVRHDCVWIVAGREAGAPAT